MSRSTYYIPQIDRFLVKVLYFEAQAKKTNMKQLTNEILEKQLRQSPAWTKAEEDLAATEQYN